MLPGGRTVSGLDLARRHYSAVPVCIAAGGLCWAVFGLLGWEPLVGFASGLLVSVLFVSAVFAVVSGGGE